MTLAIAGRTLIGLHKDIAGEEFKYKPQIILDYNETKGAVDTFDKMMKEYVM